MNFDNFKDGLSRALSSNKIGNLLGFVGILISIYVVQFGVVAVSGVVLGTVFIFFSFMYVAWKTQDSPSSHWAVTKSFHQWEIFDIGGSQARYDKRIEAICQADGIFFWKDLLYGTDRKLEPGDYVTDSGEICQIKPDGRAYRILIALYAIHNKKDKFTFTATRHPKDAFVEEHSWVSVSLEDIMRGPLIIEVIFPPDAKIGLEQRLEIRNGASIIHKELHCLVEKEIHGSLRMQLYHEIAKPRTGAEYKLSWKWIR